MTTYTAAADEEGLFTEEGGSAALRRQRVGGSRRPAPQRPRSRPTSAPDSYYPDVFAFVADFWVDVYAHQTNDMATGWCWCPSWWDHVEALARLESAWKAWEVLRLDPGTGASVWFRDHADPCMRVLTSSEGPFSRCTNTDHKPAPRLPLTTPPAGLTADRQ